MTNADPDVCADCPAGLVCLTGFPCVAIWCVGCKQRYIWLRDELGRNADILIPDSIVGFCRRVANIERRGECSECFEWRRAEKHDSL